MSLFQSQLVGSCLLKVSGSCLSLLFMIGTEGRWRGFEDGGTCVGFESLGTLFVAVFGYMYVPGLGFTLFWCEKMSVV